MEIMLIAKLMEIVSSVVIYVCKKKIYIYIYILYLFIVRVLGFFFKN